MQKHKINTDQVSTNMLKIQIIKYKEFRSHLEKFVANNDIRQYWLTSQKNNTGLDFCIQENLCTTFHIKKIDFFIFISALIFIVISYLDYNKLKILDNYIENFSSIYTLKV